MTFLTIFADFKSSKIQERTQEDSEEPTETKIKWKRLRARHVQADTQWLSSG